VYRLDVARPRLIERRMTRFLREPVSVRNAANVSVVATAAVVVAGGVAMRVLDHDEYPNIWRTSCVTPRDVGASRLVKRSGRDVSPPVVDPR
jgi:hypothetical protein